jgi:hypothetical protein
MYHRELCPLSYNAVRLCLRVTVCQKKNYENAPNLTVSVGAYPEIGAKIENSEMARH